jgi:hypothetical protein
MKIHPLGPLLFDGTERRTDRQDEAIKTHDDLLNVSFLGSDPRNWHVIHSLIRGEDNLSPWSGNFYQNQMLWAQTLAMSTATASIIVLKVRVILRVKGKGSVHHRTDHTGPQGE